LEGGGKSGRLEIKLYSSASGSCCWWCYTEQKIVFIMKNKEDLVFVNKEVNAHKTKYMVMSQETRMQDEITI